MASPAPNFWRAPLVPIALFVTAGVLLDRLVPIPLYFSFGFSVAALLAWLALHRGPDRALSLFYLWAASAGLGATYHHWFLHAISVTDIRHLATDEKKPARVRGIVHTEPNHQPGSGADPLRSFPTSERTRFVLQATEMLDGSDWENVSGLVQTSVEGRLPGVHVGDRVEAAGRLQLPEGAVNPGGFDFAAGLHDQGIGTFLHVRGDAEGILLRESSWRGNLFGWLGVIRGWGQATLADYLPARYEGLAGALLLGEGAGMTRDDWDKYMRTGVIHVLAISGQHLVVLSTFLWWFLRLGRVPRRYGALFIALVLIFYALLAGGRPPVMRAAWAVAVYCGGLWLRRPVLSSSVFSFAWLGVLVWNPTDAFNSGCLLSFGAVAVLLWGVSQIKAAPADPLQRLIEESRPWPVRFLFRVAREIGWFYLINALVWLAISPLAADRFHVIAPAALLIGPPLVLFTSFALIGGFMLLLSSPFLGPLAMVFAWPTALCLALCELLVDWALTWPFGYFYVPDIPVWWISLFYLGLAVFLTVRWFSAHARWMGCAGLGWLAVGLWVVLWLPRSADFCCTFVAVGHGGCTVIETPDGKTLLYDAGSLSGPDVTRLHIAPFLWTKGIRRIDEVFLSHADLDHFNGLEQLFERFRVDLISCTPTFADRNTAPVRVTLEAIERHGIPMRILKAGDVVEAGGVTLEVVHPLAVSPPDYANENSRSLVLDCRHEGLSILLTGDLEGRGLDRVLAMPARKVDVLMAPHHGSKTSNQAPLAAWARAQVVVSCQEPPRMKPKEPNVYEARGARYLTTAAHGAVTFRRENDDWIVETFASRKRWALRALR